LQASIVTPSPEFVGILNVGVIVNDGTSFSAEYKLKIEVKASTSIRHLSLPAKKRVSYRSKYFAFHSISHLLVYDADNDYPQAFGIRIFPGDNYSIVGYYRDTNCKFYQWNTVSYCDGE
jgi:hypothetical protein